MSTQPTPDELEALARKHGATSYRNRADTQHPAYGFTEDGLRNLLADAIARWGTPATGGEPVAWIRFQPPYRPDVLVQRHRPTLDGEPDTQYRPLAYLCTSPQPVREPLTDAQIKGLIDEGVFFSNCKEIVRAIEAAHGIGITGRQT